MICQLKSSHQHEAKAKRYRPESERYWKNLIVLELVRRILTDFPEMRSMVKIAFVVL